jgi:hypothetical protein
MGNPADETDLTTFDLDAGGDAGHCEASGIEITRLTGTGEPGSVGMTADYGLMIGFGPRHKALLNVAVECTSLDQCADELGEIPLLNTTPNVTNQKTTER